MFSSTLEGVSTFTHFTQNLFMSFQFPISGCVDGDPLFQRIEDHLADGVDLISVGVMQHLLTFILIGFFQDARQETTLSSQLLHRSHLTSGWLVTLFYSQVFENTQNRLGYGADQFTKTLSLLDPPSSDPSTYSHSPSPLPPHHVGLR